MGAPHVLREYALLADRERGVLVDPHGDFVWMCFPRWDSDGIFSSLVGGQGAYAITPTERHVWGGYYEPGGLIWRSRWVTPEAIIECREALALPSSPGRAVVLRRVEAVRGTARLDVLLNPRGEFGRAAPRSVKLRDDGVWTATVGESSFSWSGAPGAVDGPDGHGGRALSLPLSLEKGETHDFLLTIAARDGDVEPPDPGRAWQGTEAAWGERVPTLDHVVAQRDARHAYAVMAGLTSEGGGMVAAATTSLPERARAGRSYDYRYAWIRDQAFAGQAVAAPGHIR